MLIEICDYSQECTFGTAIRIERKIDSQYVIDTLFIPCVSSQFFERILNGLTEKIKDNIPVSQKYTSITNARAYDWE